MQNKKCNRSCHEIIPKNVGTKNNEQKQKVSPFPRRKKMF